MSTSDSRLNRRDRERFDDWKLRPAILLLGCQPYARCTVTYRTPPPIDLKARRAELHTGEHVRDRRPEFTGYGVESPCPVCGDRVTDTTSVVVCLRCSRMDARHDERLGSARQSAEIARAGKDQSEQADRDLAKLSNAARRGRAKLTEVHRRRIWCGNKHSLLGEHAANLTNLAATGRRFLMSIDQAPNFDRILDARGKITGYWSVLERQAAELLARESALNVAPECVSGPDA